MFTLCCFVSACIGENNVILQVAYQKETVILWTYVFQLLSQVHTLMSNQGSVYAPLFILGKSSARVSDLFLFLQNVWEFQVFETSTVSNKFKLKERKEW